jgi:hypothetical protein
MSSQDVLVVIVFSEMEALEGSNLGRDLTASFLFDASHRIFDTLALLIAAPEQCHHVLRASRRSERMVTLPKSVK